MHGVYEQKCSGMFFLINYLNRSIINIKPSSVYFLISIKSFLFLTQLSVSLLRASNWLVHPFSRVFNVRSDRVTSTNLNMKVQITFHIKSVVSLNWPFWYFMNVPKIHKRQTCLNTVNNWVSLFPKKQPEYIVVIN